MKYTVEAVSPLLDPEARSFLTAQGLPTEHLLFGAYGSDGVIIEQSDVGRDFLCLGEVGNLERLCIDTRTGAVVAVHRSDGSVWYINENVVKFAQSLDAFTARFPFYPQGSEPDVYESAASNFQSTLLQIDPTALDEDPGYWRSILNDIAIGDYSDE